MSNTDLLHELCNEINQEWDNDVDRYVEAVCNRFDMMIMEAQHGQGSTEQG